MIKLLLITLYIFLTIITTDPSSTTTEADTIQFWLLENATLLINETIYKKFAKQPAPRKPLTPICILKLSSNWNSSVTSAIIFRAIILDASKFSIIYTVLHVAFTPLHTSEAPMHVCFTPFHVSEVPMHISFTPLHTSEALIHVCFTSLHVADALMHVSEAP